MEELAELAGCTSARGSAGPGDGGRRQLTNHDALGAHAEAELNIDPTTSPTPGTAWASMVSFTVGALLPLLTIVLVATGVRVRSPWSPWSRRSPSPGG